MLSFIFELRIDWYTNKGQTSSTVNERNVMSLRSVIQWESIGSIHKMIFFITSQQSNGIVLCYKTFLYRHAAQRDCADDSVIVRIEMMQIFVKSMI